VLAAWLFVALAGCGGAESTLAEYAEQVEALTTDLYDTADRIGAEIQAKAEPPALPPAEDLHAAYRELADVFREFSDGLGDIQPPPDISELHDVLLDLAARVSTTNEALSSRVDEFKDGDDWDALMATPEAQAALAAQEEIVSFCQARQAELDATATREGLSDAAWIPAEMQEVILVAFGCDR
jgi:hypothetical protein